MAYRSTMPSARGKAKGREKSLPGGLKLVNELKEYPLAEIMVRMMEEKMVCKPEWHPLLKTEHEKIVRSLRSPVSDSLREYITRLTYYNQLQFASEILESRCEDRPRGVESIEELNRIYRINMDPYFFERQKVAAGVIAELVAAKSRRPLAKVKVLNADYGEGALYVEVLSSAKLELNANETYDIYINPTHFNYATRCRTLDLLEKKMLMGVAFPETNTAMSENYAQAEQHLLQRLPPSTAQQLNSYQQMAICGMLLGQHGSAPYILFGPPGTGKTKTLVEATRLILLQDHKCRLLVCTPSNAAADLFTKELLEIDSIQNERIYRLFSLAQPVGAQSVDLRDVVCIVDSNESATFGIPPAEKLKNDYQVVVSTLAASSYLISGGLKDHFTHIIIDEAGQADELDTLTPIVGLAGEKTRIVLAGDPHQLGPVEACEPLKQFNVNNSLLERFITRKCYTGGDRRLICMLRDNYRSHEAIISVASRMFYGGMLMASAGDKDTLCRWEGLPRKDFPVIWEAVHSDEESETSGFSYRNLREATLVKQYVDQLLSHQAVQASHIGVVTPYRYQAKTIRELMAAPRYQDICVDSVEKYQGSERRIIIVSTVRNTGLGFLDCRKRFNTTITRAKELLIIIGNPVNLSQSAVWREFVRYCEKNEAVVRRPENQLQIVQKKSSRQPGYGNDQPSQNGACSTRTLQDPTSQIVAQFGSKVQVIGAGEEEMEEEEPMPECRPSEDYLNYLEEINALIKKNQATS